MQREIKQRWDNDKLARAAHYFGTTTEDLKIQDGFESFIYEYERDGNGYILRIGHSHRRNLNLIHAEIDWINFLADGGANVARAITSEEGHLVEAIDDGHGEQFLVTAFVKASGDHLAHEQWTPEFIQHYGETLGHIHQLSKSYTPSQPDWQRFQWEDLIQQELADWKEQADPIMIEKVEPLIERLLTLPKDETHHMIHQDAHGGNFYVNDKGHITLFDFDDCVYGHEIYDIAMVIFYGPIHTSAEAAQTFTANFLKGYIRKNPLDTKLLSLIPDFMKLREIDLYILIERDVNWKNGEDPWAQRYMHGRYERIVADTPVTQFDFTSLRDLLNNI